VLAVSDFGKGNYMDMSVLTYDV